MAFLRAIVKSIQRGTITYASGGTSATATITAVSSTARAEVLMLGENLAVGAQLANISALTFTNTTTITADRTTGQSGAGGNIAGTVKFQVTEWY
jgi:hypothetical protein